MEIIETKIKDLLIIKPDVFTDERGYFFESYNKERFAQHNLNMTFVQDNESCSSRGVVRGLHFQLPPYSQSKLVRVVEGTVLDVAVDIRRWSPSYGKHVAVELSADNKRQFFIPKGFAHGFAVLSERAVFQYKCDQYYQPEAEGAIAWDDPTLTIDWKIDKSQVLLSEKDRHHPMFNDFKTPFTEA